MKDDALSREDGLESERDGEREPDGETLDGGVERPPKKELEDEENEIESLRSHRFPRDCDDDEYERSISCCSDDGAWLEPDGGGIGDRRLRLAGVSSGESSKMGDAKASPRGTIATVVAAHSFEGAKMYMSALNLPDLSSLDRPLPIS